MERKAKDFFLDSGEFSERNKELELPRETFINCDTGFRAIFDLKKREYSSKLCSFLE